MKKKYSDFELQESRGRIAGMNRGVLLVIYDLLLFVGVILAICLGYHAIDYMTISFLKHPLLHAGLLLACVFLMRFLFGVYHQILRYGGSSVYLRLIVSDFLGGTLYYLIQAALPIENIRTTLAFSMVSFNLILSMGIRLLYVALYGYVNSASASSDHLLKVLCALAGLENDAENRSEYFRQNKVRVAIVGAGRVGAVLAEEFIKNPTSRYIPCCFIDADSSKVGRKIVGVPILPSNQQIFDRLRTLKVKEIIFALPQASAETKRELFEFYKQTGCRIRVYDYPMMQSAENGKRALRDFDIEELLGRAAVDCLDEKTGSYYSDKVVLITGGGGSIGSELCRQIAKMNPKCLIILDVYENGAYDIQQELRIAYGDKLNLCVEIVSVCDRAGLEKVFATYRPDILLHAAAHKHVPLMEHNCCEAVKNNVFGTLNTVELSERYGVGRFIMVSTDKAVNPTNVMGATKRMCEMIVQSHSQSGSRTVYSATRFGNVLGSAGSVIPLFKRQIKNGGPITLTDKRIIRYFMTIPEASQLVLQSGAMAKNGELFVLDMGKPVKILELALNMISLSGLRPYDDIDIVETGLRPGEKLYEELLIRSDELDKTENSKIFIERDQPLPLSEVEKKLEILRRAVETEDDQTVKMAMREVVPTFYAPETINHKAAEAREMKQAEESLVH